MNRAQVVHQRGCATVWYRSRQAAIVIAARRRAVLVCAPICRRLGELHAPDDARRCARPFDRDDVGRLRRGQGCPLGSIRAGRHRSARHYRQGAMSAGRDRQHRRTDAHPLRTRRGFSHTSLLAADHARRKARDHRRRSGPATGRTAESHSADRRHRLPPEGFTRAGLQ